MRERGKEGDGGEMAILAIIWGSKAGDGICVKGKGRIKQRRRVARAFPRDGAVQGLCRSPNPLSLAPYGRRAPSGPGSCLTPCRV